LTKEELQERIDEVKATVTVPEVLQRYGVEIRRGRCRGICHDGKDLNAKVTNDYLWCYVCDEAMDIFAITQHFEGCDFWTAFELLGGSEKPSWRATVIASNAKRARLQKEQEQKQQKLRIRSIHLHITAYRLLITKERPFSDRWCYYQNKLQYQIYLLENLLELDK
jgi:hypothetical protein